MPYDPQRHRLVLIGGLHRSGTTLLGRIIAAHPDASGFDGTGVPADEGQHLQDVYPTAKQVGGTGRFGFHPGAHLTESSDLVGAESARRILASWEPYWELERRVLVEKSPPNLIRGRFLQALFPEASFVMVVRHPIAVALATQKWSRTSLSSLVRHWLVCHETFEEDRPRLRRLHVVSYEELVADPEETVGGVLDFLELERRPIEAQVEDGNARYLERWKAFQRSPRGLVETPIIRLRYARRVERFGYRI